MSTMQETPLPASEANDTAADSAANASDAVESPSSAQNTLPSVGQQLRTAREAMGYSLDEVASKLKLGPDQVAALEDDELSRLNCNAIARGFIRNYARLLGLDATALMHQLGRIVTARENTFSMPHRMNVVVPNERSVAWRDYYRIIAGAFLLLAAAAAYLFLPADFIQKTVSTVKNTFGISAAVTEHKEENQAETNTAETTNTANMANTAGQPATAARSTSDSTPSTPATDTPATITPPLIIAPGMPAATTTPTPSPEPAAPASAQLPAQSPATPTDAKSNVLKFSFAKASWVEVKDRNGKVIFSQLNAANSEREVSGQPPLSLLIGNASGVSLSYQGKPVDLSKRSKDDVARVTVE